MAGFRKQRRAGFSVHVNDTVDKRTRLHRVLAGAERLLFKAKHHEYDVGLRMALGIIDAHENRGIPLGTAASRGDRTAMRSLIEGDGQLAANKVKECMAGFIQSFALLLVPEPVPAS
jgi:hypothetical protein